MDSNNNDNLPRKAMNSDPERTAFRLGLMSVPVVILLAIILRWNAISLLLGGVLIPICVGLCATFFLSGGRLSLERFYLRIGNRHKRDLDRLTAWSEERGLVLEVVEAIEDVTRYRVALQPEGLSGKAAEDEQEDWFLPRVPPPLARAAMKEAQELEATLGIESTRKGHLLELRVPLSDAWREALAPCMAQRSAQQTSTRQRVVLGEEDPTRRPFLLPQKGLSKPKYEHLLTLDEPLLWCALHYDFLDSWVDRMAWGEDERALFGTYEVSPGLLEQELSYLARMHEAIIRLLVGHKIPLYEQICGFLDHRLLLENDPKFAQEHERLREEEVAIEWWLFLFERYREEEDITAFAVQFFAWSTSSQLEAVFSRCSEELREAFLLPALQDFMAGGWLVYSQTNSPLPKNHDSTHYWYLFRPYWPSMLVFDDWFELLTLHTTCEAFQALCVSIVEGPFALEDGPERVLVNSLRQTAMTCWADSEPTNPEAKLLAWLDELDVAMIPAVLDSLEELDNLSTDVEEAMHPWLFVEAELPEEAHMIRWEALRVLDKVVTLRSREVLQKGLDTWEGGITLDPLPLTRELLARLKKKPPQGGLSLTEEDERAEGHLSLTDDEAAAGQLSLSGEGQGEVDDESRGEES